LLAEARLVLKIHPQLLVGMHLTEGLQPSRQFRFKRLLGLGIGSPMTGPRPQIRVAQAMQQMIDAGKRTEHAELCSQDPLDIDAAERADLIRGPRSRFQPLTDLLFLLRRERRLRLLAAAIIQAFQSLCVVARHPPLADPP
jgi:hypothetical protein